MHKNWRRLIVPPLGLAGLGVEGRASLDALRGAGIPTPQLCDQNPQALAEAARAATPAGDWHFSAEHLHGGEDWSVLSRCRTVLRSPGVPPWHPALIQAAAQGARITSATALCMQACAAPIVGVTGTLGKGTTVSLIAEALRTLGRRVWVGGNFGENPLTFLEQVCREDIVVLELSSFQLVDLEGPRPQVAVVLRTTEDHLDWHSDAHAYRAAKRRLLAPQGCQQQVIACGKSTLPLLEVVPAERTGVWRVLAQDDVPAEQNWQGIRLASGQAWERLRGEERLLPQLERLCVPGVFQRENAAAAWLAVCAVCGELSEKDRAAALEAIMRFRGLPMRLSLCGTIQGPKGAIHCYNDSYATRPQATVGAIASFDQPLAVILGGSEKHADFGPLARALCQHPHLVCAALMGTTAARLAEAICQAAQDLSTPLPLLHRASNLQEAFAQARRALPTGGVLLLSPACASLDQFLNYAQRGRCFEALVRSSAKGNSPERENCARTAANSF